VWESVVVILGQSRVQLFGEEVLSAPIHSSPIWSPNRSFKELGSFLPTSISDAALGHRVEVQDTNTPSHVLARQKTSQRGLP
jgi:hypothetical protein